MAHGVAVFVFVFVFVIGIVIVVFFTFTVIAVVVLHFLVIELARIARAASLHRCVAGGVVDVTLAIDATFAIAACVGRLLRAACRALGSWRSRPIRSASTSAATSAKPRSSRHPIATCTAD
jgi:hypothetical protein